MSDKPRTFMSPAYIRQIEDDLFEMYRDIEIEENGKREKFGKSIGPIMVLRRLRQGEKPDFISSSPDGSLLELKNISGPKPDLLPPDLQLK